MAFGAPGGILCRGARTWPSRAGVGPTDGTVAQTVIAQVLLPTCSSMITTPSLGTGCAPGETTIVVP